MTSLQMLRFCCFVLCALASPACVADIYAFVDGKGTVHLSNFPVDERYFLFRKQPKQPDPPVAAPQEGSAEEMPIQAPERAVGEFRRMRMSKPLASLIDEVSREHDVDPALVQAVISVESGFNVRALSPKGASGLMQLMPGTAQRFGATDVWDPVENLRAGTRYLRHLLTMFKDNVSLALAAYNAGEGAVIAAGHAIPPYAETRRYVPKVLRLWQWARAKASNSRQGLGIERP